MNSCHLCKIADLEDVNYKDIKARVINILKNYHETSVGINILDSQLKFLKELTPYGMSYLNRTKEEIANDISVFSEELRIKKSLMDTINKILGSKKLSPNEKILVKYCYIDKNYNQDTYDTIVKRFNQRKKIYYNHKQIIRIRNNALTKIINQIIADDEAREIFKRCE